MPLKQKPSYLHLKERSLPGPSSPASTPPQNPPPRHFPTSIPHSHLHSTRPFSTCRPTSSLAPKRNYHPHHHKRLLCTKPRQQHKHKHLNLLRPSLIQNIAQSTSQMTQYAAQLNANAQQQQAQVPGVEYTLNPTAEAFAPSSSGGKSGEE